MRLAIEDVTDKLGLSEESLLPYGRDAAKVDVSFYSNLERKGKLILVTAITPTSAGEGKTTVSIGLEDGLTHIGENACLCLREPALGPVFGLKGGATGAGRSSLVPAMDINLHFTGDFHAISAAHNLISACLDASLYFDNPFDIDLDKVYWPRVSDMNDRSLRQTEIGFGPKNGVMRKERFVINVASELMAILCLAKDDNDFLARLNKIVLAETRDGKEVTVSDLRLSHAVMRLMKYALMPNIVRTVEGNPVFVHGGPFANIAHGTSSVIATDLALRLSDYVIQEAGFGSDLGAEKFFDIVAPTASFSPAVTVLVVSLKAIKEHSAKEGDSTLTSGFANVVTHYENLASLGAPVVVAINRFPDDTDEELETLRNLLKNKGYEFAVIDAVKKGSSGAEDLAKLVVSAASKPSFPHPIYDKNDSIEAKVEAIAKKIYRASEVVYSEEALKRLGSLKEKGHGSSYICMAKTPMSLGDDPKAGPTPIGVPFHIRDFLLAAGADFVIPLSGSLLMMPGLPKTPRAVLMEDEPWK